MDKVYKEAMDAIMSAGKSGVVLPGLSNSGAVYGPGMDAAGQASGMAFLTAELEKQDPRLIEPMTSLTAPRDISMIPGGGWVSLTSNVYVEYATTGSDEDSIIAGETTNIPISQANVTKDVFKVHTFAEIVRAPLFDEVKLQQIGRNLTQILDTGLRLNFSKMVDKNTYTGLTKAGTYGLVNNPVITASYAAENDAGTSRLWKDKTPIEAMTDVNQLITDAWIASEYALDGMPDSILIDPSNYAYIALAPVTIAGCTSMLDYLLKFNIAANQGRKLNIYPSRWCIGAGVGGTQRMVAYVNSPDKVNMDLTVPLSRVMTAPNVGAASYETLFAAQFSQVKFLFTQCAGYTDGI